MSEEKKASGRFHVNLFDVVLILLAILCIVGIWQRNNIRQLFEDEQATDAYSVSFEIRRLRDSSLQYLTSGTVFYVEQDDTRISLGSIAGEVAVVDASTTMYYQNEKGETVVVEAYYPEDYSAIKAVLSCRGLEHGGEFFVEGVYSLSVNQPLTVYTEQADFEIYVTAISKVG